MHRAFEISEANNTLHTSVRFLQKAETGVVRSRYPIRAVTLIEQSPQQNSALHCKAFKNYSSGLPHQLKLLATPLTSGLSW